MKNEHGGDKASYYSYYSSQERSGMTSNQNLNTEVYNTRSLSNAMIQKDIAKDSDNSNSQPNSQFVNSVTIIKEVKDDQK